VGREKAGNSASTESLRCDYRENQLEAFSRVVQHREREERACGNYGKKSKRESISLRVGFGRGRDKTFLGLLGRKKRGLARSLG